MAHRPGDSNRAPPLARQGRLAARPGTAGGGGTLGRRPIVVEGAPAGLLYVPAGYDAGSAAPLALMLHGAGGTSEQGMGFLLHLAEEAGLLLLAIDAVRPTWDVVHAGFGPDVARIDAALGQVFGAYAIDAAHVAVGGFSDGASYALSLGVANGDLFTHVIAFSPGFLAPAGRQGRPAIFISHGTRDQVLPIDSTSRRLVPALREAGYSVEFLEFDGPHAIPPPITVAALGWFLPNRTSMQAV